MKPSLLCVSFTPLALLLLYSVCPSFSQVVGCDDPVMDCPTKADVSDDNVCSFHRHEFGAVPFNSNITSDGPLTWTVTSTDGKGNGACPNYSARLFYLGTPSSLDLSKVTAFGACALTFWNATAMLQVPPESKDFEGFGRHSVINPDRIQDLVGQARGELRKLQINSSHNQPLAFPCGEIQGRIARAGLPGSCRRAFEGGAYLPSDSIVFTNTSGPIQEEGCSVTPGGPSYRLFSAKGEDTRLTLPYSDGRKPSKDYIKRFKTGATPILTMFYNEPWNNASTGPVPFLNEPEVYLSCVSTVPIGESEVRVNENTLDSVGANLVSIFLGSLLWAHTLA